MREYDGQRLVATRALDCHRSDPVCARVAALLPELEPEPGEVCAQIYGGPGRLVLDGVVGGRPVAIEVTRVDGCEIARFDRLQAALGAG